MNEGVKNTELEAQQSELLRLAQFRLGKSREWLRDKATTDVAPQIFGVTVDDCLWSATWSSITVISAPLSSHIGFAKLACPGSWFASVLASGLASDSSSASERLSRDSLYTALVYTNAR